MRRTYFSSIMKLYFYSLDREPSSAPSWDCVSSIFIFVQYTISECEVWAQKFRRHRQDCIPFKFFRCITVCISFRSLAQKYKFWTSSWYGASLLYEVYFWTYQTRETVLHWDIQKPKKKLKIRRAAEYFWRNSMCLDSSRMFDISSQLKQKIRSQRRSKIVKPPSRLWFSVLCSNNLMNYNWFCEAKFSHRSVSFR